MTIHPDLHVDDTAHRRDLIDQLRRLRIEAGMQRSTVAAALYMRPDAVKSFELSYHRPHVASVQRQARARGYVADLVLHGLTWTQTADMRTYAAVAATARDSEVADEVARSLCVMRLAAARRHQRLTCTAVAARMGVNRRMVCQVESERDDPLLSTFQRYARALGGRLTVELHPVQSLERVGVAA